MIKVHKWKWGYRDPERNWHGFMIDILYDPGAEETYNRFYLKVPEEIANATGREAIRAETAEKTFGKLAQLKEEYLELLAPKTKTKIILFSIHAGSNDYWQRISVCLSHHVVWMVHQEGRGWCIRNDDGTMHRDIFHPEKDDDWMIWTQAREDFFVAFEKSLNELSNKIEEFFKANYNKHGEDLGKMIDAGAAPRCPLLEAPK